MKLNKQIYSTISKFQISIFESVYVLTVCSRTTVKNCVCQMRLRKNSSRNSKEILPNYKLIIHMGQNLPTFGCPYGTQNYWEESCLPDEQASSFKGDTFIIRTSRFGCLFASSPTYVHHNGVNYFLKELSYFNDQAVFTRYLS